MPTATYAIGVGPLERGSERRDVVDALNRMRFLTVRDLQTKRLLEQIGVERPIAVTADPALLLRPLPFPVPRLEREGIGKERHLVGMSAREPGGAAGDLEAGVYHAMLAHAADFIVDRFDADILFVAMERQDIREAHRVIGQMAFAERAAVLRGKYEPGELVGLMEHIDLAVGMRLHFLIFAAVARVPFRALPYAGKVNALLEALEMPGLDGVQLAQTGPLLAGIDRMWDLRERTREHLDERLPALQRRAAQTAPLVAELLDEQVDPQQLIDEWRNASYASMPPLQRPERAKSISMSPREAMLAGAADVLVVGGGPAGLGAAVGAASAGADVILAERYGFLGGSATVGLVMPMMSFYNEARAVRASDPAADLRLLPSDHGPGEAVIGGVLALFLNQLYAAGGAIPPSRATGYTVPFDPEQYKLVSQKLLDDAGVRFLLHAFASGVAGEGTPEGVVFETKSGPVVIQARAIVDCTGDGDIAAAAGSQFELGRDEDGLVQPMTLMFRIVEFDRPSFAAYAREHPDQWRGVLGLWDLIREAEAAGELDLPREELLFFATPHEREVSVNSTRVSGIGTDVWELTEAEWLSRRQMRQIGEFLRNRVPGFADAYIAQSGTAIGVRETRRIVGEYQLTAEDVLACRTFEDAIARGSYPIDMHDPQGKGTILRRLPAGGAYEIPLRCLLPDGVDRLLVAGRCISVTHEAQSSYRVTPIAMATGHAAGVCAAIAAATNERPRDVDHRAVQVELVRQGANLRSEIAQRKRAEGPPA